MPRDLYNYRYLLKDTTTMFDREEKEKNKVYTAVSVWNKKDVPYCGALNHAISFVSDCVFVCSDAPRHFFKKKTEQGRRV